MRSAGLHPATGPASLALLLCACAATFGEPGSDTDEFRIKREAVFEFAERPSVTRSGDRVGITFTAKGFCDATVAIEDAHGRIVRHLASGVLGANAPAPFAKNAKRQSLAWDGKDDQGRYLEDKDALTVRVSLGLKPRFERTLFWSPKKRISPGNRPNFAAAPEGVYVHEGGGVDHIRLFDHKGNYVRTVYPFPPDRSLPGAKEGPEALKADFGDRLCLHGGIDMQHLLPEGSPEQVTAEAQHYCDVLGEGGGYILSPAHFFQPDVPPENIIAMYATTA